MMTAKVNIMQLTTSSILNVTVISGMAVLLLWLILSKQWILNRVTFPVLFACLALLLARIILPVEYQFTTTIGVWHVLPKIRDFLMLPIVKIFDFQVQLYHVLYLIWLVGSVVLGVRALRGRSALKRCVKVGADVKDREIQEAFALVLEQHKIKKPIRLIQSEEVGNPMIFGIRTPCIFLPEIKLSVKEWAYILEHEVAHYCHGDLYVKYLLTLLTVLYWWNPFVHILSDQVSKVLELRTDQTVIASKSEEERLEYGNCLLQLSKQSIIRKKKAESLAISFIGYKSFSLSQRFFFVTERSDEKKGRLRANLVVLPMLICTLLSFCFIFEPHYRSPEKIKGTIVLTPENAYMIKNAENGYDVYYEGEYFGSTQSGNLGVELPIYDSEEDVP